MPHPQPPFPRRIDFRPLAYSPSLTEGESVWPNSFPITITSPFHFLLHALAAVRLQRDSEKANAVLKGLVSKIVVINVIRQELKL